MLTMALDCSLRECSLILGALLDRCNVCYECIWKPLMCGTSDTYPIQKIDEHIKWVSDVLGHYLLYCVILG